MANIKKVQNKWMRVLRILGQKGADDKTSGMFYKALVQLVLIFGSETWVVAS